MRRLWIVLNWFWNEGLEDIELELIQKDDLPSITYNTKNIGEIVWKVSKISLGTQTGQVAIFGTEVKQMTNTPTIRNVNDVKLHKKLENYFSCRVTSTAILPNKRMTIADFSEKNRLFIFTNTDSFCVRLVPKHHLET